ncbi:MAG: hypothetical protein QOI07_2159 [Verrucomicrobiota bacterium]|jgi:hypothetical protein
MIKARIAGFFWLMTIVTGMAAFLIGGRLIVPGDAATTAASITANATLYRFSFTASLAATLCYLIVTVFIYALLKPVNRNIALFGAFVSLTGCALGGITTLLFLAPLTILDGAKYLSVFSADQLHALALAFATVSLQGNDIGLVFFACHVFSIGYLIRRSTFLPRFLGTLLFVTGVCYLAGSFANFFSLSFKAYLLPFVAIGGLLGEGTLTGWLLAKGVNVQRWREQAGAAAR